MSACSSVMAPTTRICRGQNVAYLYLWAEASRSAAGAGGRSGRRQVDVIVALGPAVWAAKRRPRHPIVFAFSGDPVGVGGREPRRPGGNLRASSMSNMTLPQNGLRCCKEFLTDQSHRRPLQSAEPCNKFGDAGIEAAHDARRDAATSPPGIPTTLMRPCAALRERPMRWWSFTDRFAVLTSSARFVDLAARHRGTHDLFGGATSSTNGGLMTYGPDMTVADGRAASYVDRIIRAKSLRISPSSSRPTSS